MKSSIWIVVLICLFICSIKISYSSITSTATLLQAQFKLEAYVSLDISYMKNYSTAIQGSALYCSIRCLNIDSCYHYDTCKINNEQWCISYDLTDIKPPVSTQGNCRRFRLVQICENGQLPSCGCATGQTGPRCNEPITTVVPVSVVTSTSNQYVKNCEGQTILFVAYFTYTFIQEVAGEMKQLYCEVDSNGGWIIIQMRQGNTTDFYRSSNEYENGFGGFSNNFYLGNKYIYNLTNTMTTKLLVDLQDHADEWRYAEYNVFSIGGETTEYLLNIGGYSGTAGDSMISTHHGRRFSTFDKDFSNMNCAQASSGAWWYASSTSCHESNLNGVYGSTDLGKGINWLTWHGLSYSMKTTKMKIQQK